MEHNSAQIIQGAEHVPQRETTAMVVSSTAQLSTQGFHARGVRGEQH
jgi:hypothetical protein